MAGYTGSHNPLLVNYFEFVLERVPTMVYFCQTANIPGINFGVDTQPTNLGFPVVIPVGSYKFEPLTLTFKVDENLQNWLEIFEWMTKNGNYGQSCNQNPYQSQSTADVNKTTSLGFLSLTNSSYNSKIKVQFNNLFPISLSGIQFSTVLPESVEAVATVQFAFTNYTIVK